MTTIKAKASIEAKAPLTDWTYEVNIEFLHPFDAFIKV